MAKSRIGSEESRRVSFYVALASSRRRCLKLKSADTGKISGLISPLQSNHDIIFTVLHDSDEPSLGLP